MPSRVGSRYQIVIERAVREQLGIKPGWMAVETVVDDHLEVRFVPPKHDESLAGIFNRYSTGPVPDEDWHAIKEDAWFAHVDAKWGPPRSSD